MDRTRSIDWHLLQYPLQSGLQRCVADIQRVYRSNPALYEVDFDWHGFEWLESHDNENSVFAFLRRGRDPNDCWSWCPTSRRAALRLPRRRADGRSVARSAEHRLVAVRRRQLGNAGQVWATTSAGPPSRTARLDAPAAGRDLPPTGDVSRDVQTLAVSVSGVTLSFSVYCPITKS